MPMFSRLNKLPFELRVALLGMVATIALNILWAASQYGAKIDPGLATLSGAIIGFAIVGQQARRGFLNLIRSQAHQAEIDRDARLHKADLDRSFEKERREKERDVLLSAMWAETTALWSKVKEAEQGAAMYALINENFAKQRLQNTTKGIIIATFDAPVFKANIPNLGLLGSSLAADLVSVMARATGKDSGPFEQVVSYEMLGTIYRGNAEVMKHWREDLFHVAMRIAAIQNGQPDPGNLHSMQAERRKASKLDPEKTF